MSKMQCNLCEQEFEKDDPDLFIRMQRHEEWHKPSPKELESGKRRNTAMGDVEWIAKD